nr:MAG TPA: hypothetical protein [Caudoviricetes sp.]
MGAMPIFETKAMNPFLLRQTHKPVKVSAFF